ncbi:MAG TPA: hypothetical protein VGL59_14090, partial [Polyangia bacterium]
PQWRAGGTAPAWRHVPDVRHESDGRWGARHWFHRRETAGFRRRICPPPPTRVAHALQNCAA